MHWSGRWRRPARFPLDAALALATFIVSFALTYGDGARQMTWWGSAAAGLAAAAAVWLSSRRPLISFGLVLALAVLPPMTGTSLEVLHGVVVLVAFRATLETDLRPWIVASAALLASTVYDVWQRASLDQGVAGGSVVYSLMLTALAVAAGAQARSLRRQHAELTKLRDAERLRAISEERRRIGRDIHDVAAHHLSALVVRNKLAQRQATPDALADAAAFTARTAADALDSLRQVVRVLGTDRDAPLAPLPGLAEIDAIVARMEAAGLQVARAQEPLPPTSGEVELALVRIVQEALANVLRHRGPGRCWLTITRRDDEVQLVVDDDGSALAHATSRSSDRPVGRGHGLIGMRERAEACEGRLTVGASPRGGWRVTAVLPATRA